MAVKYPMDINNSFKEDFKTFNKILEGIYANRKEEKSETDITYLLNKDDMKDRLEDIDEIEKIDPRIVAVYYSICTKKNSNLDSVEAIVQCVVDEFFPQYTRFEKARIIGSRALQIAYGAPVAISLKNNDFKDTIYDYKEEKTENEEMLMSVGCLDPVNVAMVEYSYGAIPITITNQMEGL